VDQLGRRVEEGRLGVEPPHPRAQLVVLATQSAALEEQAAAPETVRVIPIGHRSILHGS